MGTSYNVTVIAAADKIPEDLDGQILTALNRVDQLMSTYKPDSQLNQLNTLAVAKPMVVAPELAEVLAVSRRVYLETGGAFEPAVGPLVDLWGFGTAETRSLVPNEHLIAEARALLGFDKLEIDGQSVTRLQPVRIDLSAVAKGYAADLVSERLDALGLYDHLVEVGGEMRLSGSKPDGQLWRIGIEQPQLGRGEPQAAIAVSNAGVATSGDYRIYFERDGVRYSHTIDPRTGYPVTHRLASVTVIADNAARADALATAFMVMGADQSLQLAEKLDIAIYLLVKEGDGFTARHSSAFQSYLPE